MGIKLNSIVEDNLTKNLDFFSEDNSIKKTLLFSSEKAQLKNKTEKSNNISITEELNKSTKTNSINITKNDTIKYKFEWKEDSIYSNTKSEVLLFGTFFDNWDNYAIMEKNDEKNIYEYEMNLKRKEYYFKFIVNNRWFCSNFYPTKLDENNNLNNYIDLTNYKENETDSDLFDNNTNILNSETNLMKYQELKKLKRKAPQLLYYKKGFFSEKTINKYGNINNCYKELLRYRNETLEHLIPDIKNSSYNKNYYRISLTERNNQKLISIVYYRPK